MTATEYFIKYQATWENPTAEGLKLFARDIFNETVEIAKKEEATCPNALVEIIQDQNYKFNRLAMMVNAATEKEILKKDFFSDVVMNNKGAMAMLIMLSQKRGET